MNEAASHNAGNRAEPANDVAHAHSPHLAHHFDTPQQQYASAKLGMWVFLGTEILMFGGLFCAYGVYRHGHPEVFALAHRALDPVLGGINTVVLIASSFTMALAVRFSQLGKTRPLVMCLALTILGGFGFMAIKTIEYKAKFEHHLFPGRYNVYNAEFNGDSHKPEDPGHIDHSAAAVSEHPEAADSREAAERASAAPTTRLSLYVDPSAGTSDATKIKPNFADTPGLAAALPPGDHPHKLFSEMSPLDQKRMNTFFSIYFMMTGLHGLHVLIGMGLIGWVLIRARKGEFGPDYFTPVDLVGLYWHLVDLVWIFLFPLLYLIH
jgi:cytochrome c oxidase subunit 3